MGAGVSAHSPTPKARKSILRFQSPEYQPDLEELDAEVDEEEPEDELEDEPEDGLARNGEKPRTEPPTATRYHYPEESEVASLNAEQNAARLPIRWARETGRHAWEVIDPKLDPEHYPFLETGDYPEVVYGENWIKTDERELWNQWTWEDEMTLSQMEPAEFTVWHRAKKNYGIPAADIMFGDYVYVWTQGLSAVKIIWNHQQKFHGEESIMVEPRNWGQNFCVLFAQLLCCEAFVGNLQFLRYTLQYALSLRLGKKDVPLPKKSLLDTNWFEALNEKMALTHFLENTPNRLMHSLAVSKPVHIWISSRT